MNILKHFISLFSKNTKRSPEHPSFDSIADQFDRYADKQFITSNYERPYIVSHLPDLNGLTFLDAGCGSGFFSVYAIHQGAKVISIDSSHKMIEITRLRTNNKTSLHHFDLSKGSLNFLDDESVDVTVCSLTLHYIENWVTVLNEFYRVMKTGGTCIISVHHPIYDYLNFNRGKYFQKRLIGDQWRGFGEKPLKVNYYVRPLKEYLAPFIDSKFKIISIDEPLPPEEFKNQDLNSYNRLGGNPGFLFFLLRK
jgi:ubiquinone/menaquinone biosynthesis C-methylase UbiE